MGATILVVDDNPVVLAAMEAALDDAGYEVVTAETGELGLQRAVEQPPDAAIVDFELPGIDGLAVIHRLATHPGLDPVPCILLTGAEQAPAELEGLESGADAYIRKGTETDVILARLRALLRETHRTPRPPALRPRTKSTVLAVTDTVDDAIVDRTLAILDGEGHDTLRCTRVAAPGHLRAGLDCVILDLRDGALDVLRALKYLQRDDEIPIVCLMTSNDTAAIVAAIDAGADDCVPATSGLEVFVGHVHAQLRRKRIDDAIRARYEERLEAEKVRARAEIAEERARHLAELERKNTELEEKNEALADMLKELRARDRQFRTVARCVPGVVYLCRNDDDRSMLFMSVMVERMSPYRAADFTEGRATWAELVHRDDLTRVLARIESALAQKHPFVVEYRMRNAEGTYGWVEERGRAIFDDDDCVRCIGGTMFDVTERKEAEEELERFRTRTWRASKDGPG